MTASVYLVLLFSDIIHDVLYIIYNSYKYKNIVEEKKKELKKRIF